MIILQNNLNQICEDKHTLDSIIDDTKRIENLISKSLEFGLVSQLDERQYIPVINILNQVLEEANIVKQIHQNRIIIKHLTTIDADIKINVDTEKIKQAIRNITQNAIDALIEVEDRQRIIDFTIHDKRDIIQIIISDNGPGISEKNFEEESKIFGQFETTKELTENSGVGLGLTITQAIILPYRKYMNLYAKQLKFV